MGNPANYSISLNATMSAAVSAISVGQLILYTAAGYVVSTTAARAGGLRSSGIALSAASTAVPYLNFQTGGYLDPSISTLGAGAQSWVRCSTTGGLERVTPSGSDDIVGFAEADGGVHLCFGFLTAAMINAAAGGAPTGTGIAHVSAGAFVSPAALIADADVATGAAIAGTKVATTAAQAISALSIDWATGTVFTKTLSAGGNTFTFANAASGMCISVRLTGAASTVTWPTVKWASGAAPAQTASGTDVYTFVHDGTSIYGSAVQAMA